MRENIFVVTHGSQWKVDCGHCKASGIYSTQADAITAARQHVATHTAGKLAEIRVQGLTSQWRTEWTYGKDPFPPKG